MRWKYHRYFRHTGLDDFINVTLAFAHSIGFSFISLTFLWKFSSRPRPNYFAYCNYQGYRDAFHTGNFSFYLSNTDPTRVLDHKHCDPRYPMEPLASFPSGHAANAAASFSLASFIIVASINRITLRFNFLKGLIMFLHYFAGGIIAFTRILDHFHHYDDVGFGIVLGVACGAMAYLLHFDSHFGQKRLKTDKETKYKRKAAVENQDSISNK
jgi:membrane-associated phospholipid phosphatase